MSLLALIPEQDRQALRTIVFHKGDILCHEGDACDGVYLLDKGQIKISSYTFGGSEVVYNVVGEGGVFGNNLVFASDNAFRGNVIALTDGEIVFIPQDQLVGLLQKNALFLKEYLKVQSDFGKSLNSKIKLLSFNSAEDRLIFFLQTNGKKAHYTSVTALAESLFLQRETLSRLLHRLEGEGRIRLGWKTIELIP